MDVTSLLIKITFFTHLYGIVEFLKRWINVEEYVLFVVSVSLIFIIIWSARLDSAKKKIASLEDEKTKLLKDQSDLNSVKRALEIFHHRE
jgi:hypothetical protein